MSLLIRKKIRKGFTLVEMMLSFFLMALILLAIVPYGLFLLRNTVKTLAATKMHTQLSFALEEIQSRCFAAVEVKSYHNDPGSYSIDMDEVYIFAEQDPFTVTFDDTSDNEEYTYQLDALGNFVVLVGDPTGSPVKHILIDSIYEPEFSVHYEPDEAFGVTIPLGTIAFFKEPQVLWVRMSVINPEDPFESDGVTRKDIVSVKCVRFWYTKPVED